MKSITRNFFDFYKTPLQLKSLCERLLQYFLSSPLWRWVSLARTTLSNHVSQVLRTGRSAAKAHLSNSRHLVGDVFLLAACGSFVLYHFFPSDPWDKNWYYTNWFYFLRTLRPWMIGLFATVAILFYWPKKSKSVYIVFTILHSLCWLGIIHYAFLVNDYKSFHSYPSWSYWVLAGSFGMGFMLCAEHLVFVFEHKIKGNHKRWVMLEEHKEKLDRETRERMLANNLNEYKNLYTNY